MVRILHVILFVFLGGLAYGRAVADLPAPRLDRLTPLGAAAGSTVDVTIAGADLDGPKTLLCDHPGIAVQYRKDKTFALVIDPGVAPGTYDLWFLGQHGLSNPRLFEVSRGLQELTEKEPNDEPAAAQTVPVNAVVNGTSDQNRDDRYRVAARKGQRIVIECRSAALDTTLDANLVLTDANGKSFASNGGYNGRDPLIDFVAPADGDYLVNVFDLSYRGGHPYRLIVTDRPHVENAFPRAIQVGQPTTITYYGRNLGPTAKTSNWFVNDLALDALPVTLTVPAGALDRMPYRFFDHPTAHSVLPTAATCTLAGRQIRFDPAVRGTPVYLSETAVTLEAEPNDAPDAAQPIALPAVLAGRFDRERDADWFTFTAAEDGTHVFDVFCERIAGRADPYILVTDAKGNRVAEFDDFGHRLQAFDGHLRDPVGTTGLSKGKTYRVLVQDRYRRGGARYQYVLTVRRPVPDFFVAGIHSQNPAPAGLTLRRGGAMHLDLAIHRTDGYTDAITVAAEGLPKGVHAAPVTIAGANSGAIVFWADADAPESAGYFKLIATGSRGGMPFAREVRAYTRVSNAADYSSSRPMREFALATTAGTAPFAWRFANDRVELDAGKKIDVKVSLDRLWPEFKGNLTLIPHAFPGSIRMTKGNIAAGNRDATATFEAQPGTAPGDYSLTVLAQAQVPFRKTDSGPAANVLVTLPSRPITLVIRAAKKP